MSFFWARILSLLARVVRLGRRLAFTETDELGLPHQGKQILIDNLSDRGYGSAVAAIDVATRPRPRVRKAVNPSTPRLRRAAVADAHHEYWIERDAYPTGETSVGRPGARLHGV